MDSIDYYNRYAVPYYEKTVDADMGEVMKPFVELLPENAEVLDLGCGSGRDTLALEEWFLCDSSGRSREDVQACGGEH